MKTRAAIAFYLAVFLLLSLFLSVYSEFHFYHLEQNQLFQHSWPSIREMLFCPGGFVRVLAEGMVQHFIIPHAGALLTAALLTGVMLLTRAVLRRIDGASTLFLLPLLPALALLFCHFDFNYPYQGTIAFALMLASLLGVLSVKRETLRLLVGMLVAVGLFLLAGPIALLFAFTLLMCEWGQRGVRWYYSFAAVVIVVLLGMWSVSLTHWVEYRHAFLPDGYYHLRLVPGKVIYLSWLSLLVGVATLFLLRTRSRLNGRGLWLSVATQTLLLGLLLWKGVGNYGDAKSYRMKELDYYARTEQWQKITDMCRNSPTTNYLYICYANMALAHQGLLAEEAFGFDQRGSQGMLVTWNKASNVSTLLSDVYFAMGYVSLAQKMAFESNISSPAGGSPRMIKRLIQTNLIYGAYPVAEKYIALLENTLYYADWAGEQRPFLYNDLAVEADPKLGPLRKGLPTTTALAQSNGLEADLLLMAEQYPSNQAALHYAALSFLLNKDMAQFKELVETYYGTELLPQLPKSYQEAVITLSEQEPGYWKRFAIPDQAVARFDHYKQQVLANRHNPNALPGLLKRSYGDTYWYYFMFK